ncbi:MAG: ATP-binding cassette domain-containing protein, partial [Acidobacteriales bacterium]|nr:ATP-binding cassette domain-containing protein [Terriglobales bacterium]
IAIMGPSGSGKSSLVNLIGCLDRATSGSLMIDGQELSRFGESDLNRFRAEKIGFVFQQFHLVPYLTALENVMLAQYFHSIADEEEALAALEGVGLRDRARHLPSQLSGGEQQRVCIARALINDPKILLADEPTGNLDAHNEDLVLRKLRELHAQGRTIIMVTHDPTVARLADRTVELHHGRIVPQTTFALSDETQIDEVLEEIWTLHENNEHAELGRMDVEGALPMAVAIERMEQAGLVQKRPHFADHTHKSVLNRCHDAVHPTGAAADHGECIIEYTERGYQRARDVVRRHRLAERLFVQTFKLDDETQVEQQACKFEHILSPEATDSICTFLGHPAACPHGSAIPPGECCVRAGGQRCNPQLMDFLKEKVVAR